MTSEITRRLEALTFEMQKKNNRGCFVVYEYNPGRYHLGDQDPSEPGLTWPELERLAQDAQFFILVSYAGGQLEVSNQS